MIIDANVSNELCKPTPVARAVHNWIRSGTGRLVTGGRNIDELHRNADVARILRGFKQAGCLREIPRTRVDQEEIALRGSGYCQSNDLHVLALALASGARLLWSCDKKLHANFTNPSIISKPRGKVFQQAGHKRLLNANNCRMSCERRA